jgi:hypothetical protein
VKPTELSYDLRCLSTVKKLTQAVVFEPLCFDPWLVASYISSFRLVHKYVYCKWNLVWDAKKYFDRLSVWFPPPEIARQVLMFMLVEWSERPLISSSLFFILRVVPTFWWGISRHLVELTMMYPHLTPLWYQPTTYSHNCVVLASLRVFSLYYGQIGSTCHSR